MKLIPPFLLLTLLSISFQLKAQPINAIAGDQSFVEQFNRQPTDQDEETLRIQTHLSYAEDLLRTDSDRHLTPEQKANRATALDLLHTYRKAEQFPTNTRYPDRRPCFVDKAGNDCAVAYLIRHTGQPELVEQINQQYQYSYVMDIQSEALLDWANTYGFRKEELALIQPAYEWDPKPKRRLCRHKIKYPKYKDGGNLGLVNRYREQFPLPDSLPWDEFLQLGLQINRRGRVAKVVMETDFDKHPSVVGMEDEILAFSKTLRFKPGRGNDGKKGGLFRIQLIYKVAEKPCNLADTLVIEQQPKPETGKTSVKITGTLTDAPTGVLTQGHTVVSIADPGTPSHTPGRYRPAMKQLDYSSAQTGFTAILDAVDHAPTSKLVFYGQNTYHRPVLIPEVNFADQELHIQLERCIPTYPVNETEGWPESPFVTIPIFE